MKKKLKCKKTGKTKHGKNVDAILPVFLYGGWTCD